MKHRLTTQGSPSRSTAISERAQRDAASALHVMSIKVIRTAQDRMNSQVFLEDPEMHAHDQAWKSYLPKW